MPTDDRYDDERDDFEDDRGRGRDRDRRPRRGLTVEEAKAKVRGPAVGLIVTAALSFLAIGLGVIQYGSLPEQFAAQNQKFDADPNMQPAQKEQAKQIMKVYEDVVTKVVPVTWVLAGVSSLLMIVGAVKMMSLSGRGLGITSSILAMLPCVSGCCVVGLPIGIWSLVVLLNPDVKAAFAAARTAGPGAGDDLDPGFNGDR